MSNQLTLGHVCIAGNPKNEDSRDSNFLSNYSSSDKETNPSLSTSCVKYCSWVFSSNGEVMLKVVFPEDSWLIRQLWLLQFNCMSSLFPLTFLHVFSEETCHPAYPSLFTILTRLLIRVFLSLDSRYTALQSSLLSYLLSRTFVDKFNSRNRKVRQYSWTTTPKAS